MGLKNSLGLSRLQSQALEGILTRKISLLHVLFIKKLFAQSDSMKKTSRRALCLNPKTHKSLGHLYLFSG